MTPARTGIAKLAADLRSRGPLQRGAIIGLLLTCVPAIVFLYVIQG